MEATILGLGYPCRGYIRIMEKKVEITILGLGFRE